MSNEDQNSEEYIKSVVVESLKNRVISERDYSYAKLIRLIDNNNKDNYDDAIKELDVILEKLSVCNLKMRTIESIFEEKVK